MKSKIVPVNSQEPEEDVIKEAASYLERGEIVAFPTETVYGIGGNAFDLKVIKKIYEVKKRPFHNPLGVLINKTEQLEDLWVTTPLEAERLIEYLWPGPLTIIFYKNEKVSPLLTAGSPKVGLRFPDHPVILKILDEIDFPLASSSANLSSRPSPTKAEHVLNDLGEKIPLILDGGESPLGIESTVIDISESPIKILRKGAVSAEKIKQIIPEAEIEEAHSEQPSYEITYKVVLVENEGELLSEFEKGKEEKKKVKAVGPHAWFREGIKIDFEEYPQKIFSLLREMEREHIDLLIVEMPPESEKNKAIRERLKRAVKKN
jgi:L-threonylcarbamoyladenylate synthase